MLNFDAIAKMAHEKTGITFPGLLRKIARISNGKGKDVKDILGWDVITVSPSGDCYEYYVAQPPLIGMSHPMPCPCILGLVPFDGYGVSIEEAVKLFHKQDCGGEFTAIALSWPLTCPASPEPYWYFRTNLGSTVVIGAGGTKKPPVIVPTYAAPIYLYGSPNLLYSAPQPLYIAPTEK
jgi:hypothetical protein